MIGYYQTDKQVLLDFGIADEAQFKALLKTLKAGFDSRSTSA